MPGFPYKAVLPPCQWSLFSVLFPLFIIPEAKTRQSTSSPDAPRLLGFLKQQPLPQDGLPASGPEQLHFCGITPLSTISCQTEGCCRLWRAGPPPGGAGWAGRPPGTPSPAPLHPLPGEAGPACQEPCPHPLLSEESGFLSLVHVRQNLPDTSMDFKHQ